MACDALNEGKPQEHEEDLAKPGAGDERDYHDDGDDQDADCTDCVVHCVSFLCV